MIELRCMSRSSEVGDPQDHAKFAVRANWPQVGMCYCANQICRYDLIQGAKIVKTFDLAIRYSRGVTWMVILECCLHASSWPAPLTSPSAVQQRITAHVLAQPTSLSTTYIQLVATGIECHY